MSKHIVILIAACLAFAGANAQSDRLVRSGNKLYEEKKYKEAAAAYQQALQKNPNSIPGIFNLGNSLYQQKQFEASRKALGAAAKNATEKAGKAGANYNIGNTYMAERKWEEAIDAYKKTLRNNPQDADAKYNLSYAKQMLKKDEGGGGKDNKDNKDKNDKNKDQQNKDNKDKGDKDKQDKDKGDQDKDKQDKGDQDKENKDKGDKEQQHPQPQPSKLSEKQAEQLLNALQQEEKKIQDKMQKEKGIPVKTEKDW